MGGVRYDSRQGGRSPCCAPYTQGVCRLSVSDLDLTTSTGTASGTMWNNGTGTSSDMTEPWSLDNSMVDITPLQLRLSSERSLHVYVIMHNQFILSTPCWSCQALSARLRHGIRLVIWHCIHSELTVQDKNLLYTPWLVRKCTHGQSPNFHAAL